MSAFPRVSSIPVKPILTGLAVFLLAGPTLIVIIASLSVGREIVFPPSGFTLTWYGHIVTNGPTWHALLNSLHVAITSVVLVILVGVPAALAMPSFKGRRRLILMLALSLGLSSPIIVSAFAFFTIYAKIGVLQHLTAVGVAIGIVNLPFMLWTVLSALEDQDPELPAAAATLGADPVEQFFFIRLPLISPGIATGAIIVFVLSITDFVVSEVLTNSSDETLPVFIYSGLRTAISPGLGAASAFFIAIAAIVFVVALRLGGVERFLLRHDL